MYNYVVKILSIFKALKTKQVAVKPFSCVSIHLSCLICHGPLSMRSLTFFSHAKADTSLFKTYLKLCIILDTEGNTRLLK